MGQEEDAYLAQMSLHVIETSYESREISHVGDFTTMPLTTNSPTSSVGFASDRREGSCRVGSFAESGSRLRMRRPERDADVDAVAVEERASAKFEHVALPVEARKSGGQGHRAALSQTRIPVAHAPTCHPGLRSIATSPAASEGSVNM